MVANNGNFEKKDLILQRISRWISRIGIVTELYFLIKMVILYFSLKNWFLNLYRSI